MLRIEEGIIWECYDEQSLRIIWSGKDKEEHNYDERIEEFINKSI
jgi:hypothetical protein